MLPKVVAYDYVHAVRFATKGRLETPVRRLLMALFAGITANRRMRGICCLCIHKICSLIFHRLLMQFVESQQEDSRSETLGFSHGKPIYFALRAGFRSRQRRWCSDSTAAVVTDRHEVHAGCRFSRMAITLETLLKACSESTMAAFPCGCVNLPVCRDHLRNTRCGRRSTHDAQSLLQDKFCHG
jgi:hypothetical protein